MYRKKFSYLDKKKGMKKKETAKKETLKYCMY